MTVDEQVLAAALLWMRNCYEVDDPRLRPEVLERINRVIAQYPADGEGLLRFHARFPLPENLSDYARKAFTLPPSDLEEDASPV